MTTTNTVQLELLKKLIKRPEIADNTPYNLRNISNSKLEQLFDTSSNSDCSSNKSEKTIKSKSNKSIKSVKSQKPSRLNLISASSIRSFKTNNSASGGGGSSASIKSGVKRSLSSSSGSKLSSNLDTFNLDTFVQQITSGKYKRILVLTGAGISTASGIPDFRTPGTGIYDNLSKYCVPYPEAIFERNYFHRNPRPFFKVAKEIMPNADKYRPNKIHFFLRLLQEKRLLLRLYTQNIDNLETVAGIKHEKLIEAHGSFRTATCIKCQNEFPGSYVENAVLNDKIPMCNDCNGVVKPDIVFFGEDLPEEFFRTYKRDFSIADLVIIIGTSLEVEPFASIINECPTNVPRILMNKNLVGPFRMRSSYRKRDLAILGDLSVSIEMLASRLGWENELNQMTVRELELIEKNQALAIQKRLEEQKNEEEMEKVLNAAAAAAAAITSSKNQQKTNLSSFSTSDTSAQNGANRTINSSNPLPSSSTSRLSNRPLLTESQIRAKSILLAKHNILKTTSEINNEDKFLCNIFEKYQNMRKKYETGIDPNPFRSEKTAEDPLSPNKKSSESTHRNKILDIYLIKSQLRLNESFKFADKIFPTESLQNGTINSTKSLKPDGLITANLLPIPMTTSNLVENLNTNRNLYVANSKPLLIKRNLDMANTLAITTGSSDAGNTVPLLGKINMEKIKLIEKKNNELLLAKENSQETYKSLV